VSRKEVILKFYERLKMLALERHQSLNQIEIELGLGKNSLYNFKKSRPKAETVFRLAEYFDVSSDYLLGESDIRDFNGADLAFELKNSHIYKGFEMTEIERNTLISCLDFYFVHRGTEQFDEDLQLSWKDEQAFFSEDIRVLYTAILEYAERIQGRLDEFQN
jgi:transcriptional regulator with XRE-family HTH domain